MINNVNSIFQILGVTPVALRAPSVTPSITLSVLFISLFTDIFNKFVILTFLMSYYSLQ